MTCLHYSTSTAQDLDTREMEKFAQGLAELLANAPSQDPLVLLELAEIVEQRGNFGGTSTKETKQ